MKSRQAIVAIAPDRRQQTFLARVMPSWQLYARRHHLEIVVIRRSITDGQHPYWDRWLTIQEGVSELVGYDDLVLLDNDIFINGEAPNIFSEWQPDKVNVVEESAQGDWKRDQTPSYYRSFHLAPDERLPTPTRVFNMGVCAITRKQDEIFRLLYEKWLTEVRPRFSEQERGRKDALFRVEADGPFLSYELQAMKLISPLRKEFNFFLIPWLRANRVREVPFLLQSKLGQKLAGTLPKPILAALTGPARAALRRAASECHFLHIAASKSPLWLLPATRPEAATRDLCS